ARCPQGAVARTDEVESIGFEFFGESPDTHGLLQGRVNGTEGGTLFRIRPQLQPFPEAGQEASRWCAAARHARTSDAPALALVPRGISARHAVRARLETGPMPTDR